jgi:uncharacterized protein (DUF2236 family)
VPGSAAEVAAYYDEIQPALAMTRDAAEALVFLLAPPMPYGLGYTPARGIYLGVATLAMALLPTWARRRYGLPGLPITDPAASLTVRALRLGLRSLPLRYMISPQYRAAMARLAAADIGS